MNYHSLKMLSLAAGFAVLGTLTAQAQDKATLNLLVIKGVITQDEADTIAKSSATPVVVTPKDAAVKGLKLEGVIQTQFDWLTTEEKTAGRPNPPSQAQAFARRAYLGAIADLGNGWGGEIMFDFAAGAQAAGGSLAGGGNAAQNNFEKMIITKKLDDYSALLTFGYQKVNFTLEEYTSSAVIKPIERSLGSRYFDEAYTGVNSGRLGFANRHNGIFWDGKIGSTGIGYGGAVTTGIQNSSGYTPVGGLNKLGFWAYLNYGNTWGDLTFKGGVNYGYSADGNSVTGPGAGVAKSESNSIWGYNPYITMTYGSSFQLDAEFLQAIVQNGRSNGAALNQSKASPYAFTITPSYKINDEWELVARYSYLFTDGRGTAINSVVRNGNSVNTAGTLFNDADQFYLGVNWYIVKNAVKFSLGYEYSEFNNRDTTAAINDANFKGPKANVSGIRARMQLLF